MRALQLIDTGKTAEFRDVAEPEPGPGEVLVRVGGAGARHSDLHLMHDFSEGMLPWSPPFTLGHPEGFGPASNRSLSTKRRKRTTRCAQLPPRPGGDRPVTNDALDALTFDECVARLEQQRVGRIALLVDE